MFYTKCIDVIIESIGPSIILRSIFIIGTMNFEKNRAFYDISMKLGTWIVDNNTKNVKGQY